MTLADLPRANLSGASLRLALLTHAYLVGAHVSGADLRGAFVDRRQLKTANLDRETRLPQEHQWMMPLPARSRTTFKK